MDISDVSEDLRRFNEARDWHQFHTPRNLMLALMGEVGELAELLQWRDDDAVTTFAATKQGHGALSDEVADVFIYLVQLAESLNIDLTTAVRVKIEKNRAAYPADLSRGSASKYTQLRADNRRRSS